MYQAHNYHVHMFYRANALLFNGYVCAYDARLSTHQRGGPMRDNATIDGGRAHFPCPNGTRAALEQRARPVAHSLQRVEVGDNVGTVLLLLEARESHRGALDHRFRLGQPLEHRLVVPDHVRALELVSELEAG